MAKSINALWEKVRDLLSFLDVATTGGDEGVAFSRGQLSVGSKTQGYETCLGGGDSYPPEIGEDYVFHCDVANTSGNVITGATDVTAIVASNTGSTTGMFGGNTVGKYVLVGCPIPYYGKKIKYNTLGTVEPENIILESYKLGVMGS